MRTKTIIEGLKNSQKFRVIFKGDGSENDIGMYMTVKQMTKCLLQLMPVYCAGMHCNSWQTHGTLQNQYAKISQLVSALLSVVNRFKWTWYNVQFSFHGCCSASPVDRVLG